MVLSSSSCSFSTVSGPLWTEVENNLIRDIFPARMASSLPLLLLQGSMSEYLEEERIWPGDYCFIVLLYMCIIVLLPCLTQGAQCGTWQKLYMTVGRYWKMTPYLEAESSGSIDAFSWQIEACLLAAGYGPGFLAVRHFKATACKFSRRSATLYLLSVIIIADHRSHESGLARRWIIINPLLCVYAFTFTTHKTASAFI